MTKKKLTLQMKYFIFSLLMMVWSFRVHTKPTQKTVQTNKITGYFNPILVENRHNALAQQLFSEEDGAITLAHQKGDGAITLAQQLFPEDEEESIIVKEKDDASLKDLLKPWPVHERTEYAFKSYSDDPVSIEDALSGSRYRCSTCRKPMHVVDGNYKRKHFRHNANTNCEGHHPESVDHYYAKTRLAKLLEMGVGLSIERGQALPPNYRLHVYNDILRAEKNDQVVVEYSHRTPENKRGIADIAVLHQGQIKFIIEVVHTHKTMEDTRPEPWYEIQAYHILSADVSEKDQMIYLREDREAKSISGAVQTGIDWMAMGVQ